MNYSFKESIDKIYKLLYEVEASYNNDSFINKTLELLEFQFDNLEERLIYLDSIGEARNE